MIDINKVTSWAEESVLTNGVNLVDIKCTQLGNVLAIAIFIDKEGGISIGDCAKTSRYFDVLAQSEGVEKDYKIEVSSPGIDKAITELFQFQRQEGRTLTVKYKDSEGNYCKKSGVLKSVNKENITLSISGEELCHIPFPKVVKAKVEVQF